MRASSSMEAGAERLRPIHRRETARERTRDFARIASMHDLVFVDHAAARRSVEASRRRFEFLSLERRLLSAGDPSGETRSLSRARDGFGKNRALASSRHISPFLRDRNPSRRDDAPRGSSRRFRKPLSDSPRRVRPKDAPMRRPNRCDPFRLRAHRLLRVRTLRASALAAHASLFPVFHARRRQTLGELGDIRLSAPQRRSRRPAFY